MGPAREKCRNTCRGAAASSASRRRVPYDPKTLRISRPLRVDTAGSLESVADPPELQALAIVDRVVADGSRPRLVVPGHPNGEVRQGKGPRTADQGRTLARLSDGCQRSIKAPPA
jgi:hypothetical protein